MNTTVLVSSLLALTLTGCILDTCPDAEKQRLRSGIYDQSQQTSEGSGIPFPHPEGDRTLEIDREAGTVTIRYVDEDGHDVVETWKIRRSRYRL